MKASELKCAERAIFSDCWVLNVEARSRGRRDCFEAMFLGPKTGMSGKEDVRLSARSRHRENETRLLGSGHHCDLAAVRLGLGDLRGDVKPES